jgi:uncharacterized protein
MTTQAALGILGSSKYMSLTTFRKDGTPVATPVWVVRDGESLRVITGADSGKAKRLRNNPAVTVAPCDMRGKPKGAAISGTALLLDPSGTAVTLELVRHKYGLMGRILGWSNERRARKSGAGTDQVGVTITLDT